MTSNTDFYWWKSLVMEEFYLYSYIWATETENTNWYCLHAEMYTIVWHICLNWIDWILCNVCEFANVLVCVKYWWSALEDTLSVSLRSWIPWWFREKQQVHSVHRWTKEIQSRNVHQRSESRESLSWKLHSNSTPSQCIPWLLFIFGLWSWSEK